MSSDNTQRASNGSEQASPSNNDAGMSAEYAKQESFVVLFDDDDVTANTQSNPVQTDHETRSEQSVVSENSDGAESTRPPGSFVVLLDDDDPEDEINSIVSLEADGHCTVNFPEDISIRYIINFKTALSRALEASSVTYDASNVDNVDTSSIQLLHAHGISLKNNNIPSQWSGRSERFATVEKRLGFDLSN